MEYINVKTAARRWNLSERRVSGFCKEGRIIGAQKIGKSWFIPEDAPRPKDHRLVLRDHSQSAGGRADDTSRQPRPLPIGVSDFRKAVTDYCYVDKTLLIRDLLDNRPQVCLFTRPRRFGKTMNMEMLRTFFERTDEDTSVYFLDKKIWACGETYTCHQGKYPVIFMSFKDIKTWTWEETLAGIKDVIQNEWLRHKELADSDRLSDFEKDYYQKVMHGTLDSGVWPLSLGALSRMLHQHYDVAPIIIIDEYDTPIQQGHVHGYYREVVAFMRSFFSSGLKDNRSLSFAFLTGILRVARESIFSGLNNLKVYSVLDDRYSQYFGFTENEVRQLLATYHRRGSFPEVKRWYDGYRFGNTEVFNPWSVINYLDDGGCPKGFWQSTGSNEIIREIIEHADRETLETLRRLMQGESYTAYIDTAIIYPEIRQSPFTIYSFLLMAGYLKATSIDWQSDGNAYCEVMIPNYEISSIYEKEILSSARSVIPISSALAIQRAITLRNAPALQHAMQSFLERTVSYHDAASEAFYHGLMLGLCAVMNNRYAVTSNRESGDGRYDIQLNPYDKELPGILMELKVLRPATRTESAEPAAGPLNDVGAQLIALARSSLRQIDKKNYVLAMEQEGVYPILKFGVAFYKKEVVVLSE